MACIYIYRNLKKGVKKFIFPTLFPYLALIHLLDISEISSF